jgi:hypothetical protein
MGKQVKRKPLWTDSVYLGNKEIFNLVCSIPLRKNCTKYNKKKGRVAQLV